MGNRALALLLAFALAGCTRVVDAPQAKPEPPVAPITALEVHELLSPRVDDTDGNLFATVEPERLHRRCA